MTTSISLNLRAVLKTAISRSGLDVPARALSGLSAAGKALLVASAAHDLPNGVVLYVVPSDGELAAVVADVGFFLATLEGLSESAIDRTVLPMPSHEIDPYRGMAPHVGVTSVARTGASCAGQRRRARRRRVGGGVVAAGERAAACAQRVDEPASGTGHSRQAT